MKKVILFVVLLLICEASLALTRQVADPLVRTELALQSVNGSSVPQRTYETVRSSASLRAAALAFYAALAFVLFVPSPARNQK